MLHTVHTSLGSAKATFSTLNWSCKKVEECNTQCQSRLSHVALFSPCKSGLAKLGHIVSVGLRVQSFLSSKIIRKIKLVQVTRHLLIGVAVGPIDYLLVSTQLVQVTRVAASISPSSVDDADYESSSQADQWENA